FFQAEDGIRDDLVTGVQTCALPIFYTSAAGGVRLWVDGRLLIDERRSQGEGERSGSIPLIAGRGYALRMEYYSRREGGASARLRSEERRVGKEERAGWGGCLEKRNS